MTSVSDQPAGSIYDLGYRRYEGLRLGRRHALLALWSHSLRSCFGLGRRTSSKIIPIALALLTLFPAAIQLAVAAVVSEDVEIFSAEGYYGYVQSILWLFCAAVAPELVGRDQRTHTLSLYFSRALRRSDYALAKFAALVSAFLILTVAPQALLFAGHALLGEDSLAYVRDNWDDIPRILVSAVLLSCLFAGIGLAVASQTPRRAYATGAVAFLFGVMWIVGGVVVQTTDETFGRWVLMLSPLHVMRGTVLWAFGASPEPESALGLSDFPMWAFGAASLAAIALSTALLVRRYERIAA